jgi:hypothetical protein
MSNQPSLAQRLSELNITPDELAAIIDRTAEEVETWVSGDAEPDGEAKILLRLITDPERTHAATLAAERIRGRWEQSLKGDARTYAELERQPAFGSGFHGATGGRPQ